MGQFDTNNLISAAAANIEADNQRRRVADMHAMSGTAHVDRLGDALEDVLRRAATAMGQAVDASQHHELIRLIDTTTEARVGWRRTVVERRIQVPTVIGRATAVLGWTDQYTDASRPETSVRTKVTPTFVVVGDDGRLHRAIGGPSREIRGIVPRGDNYLNRATPSNGFIVQGIVTGRWLIQQVVMDRRSVSFSILSHRDMVRYDIPKPGSPDDVAEHKRAAEFLTQQVLTRLSGFGAAI